jgi:glycosyltransferase involved in cell wall biosynthesis
MTAHNVVHVVVPDAVNDPLRPSGGNRYDRTVCDHLAAAGWQLHEHPIPDAWPRLSRTSREALGRVLSHIPEGSLVLVDGLLAGGSAPVLVPVGGRVSLVVLVHAPPTEVATDAEVLAAARAVIATSGWLRQELLRSYPLRPDRVEVAEPGVDPSAIAAGTPNGAELLCVAAVAHHKGHDVLLAALSSLPHRRWHCRCVGPLDREPQFVAKLRRQASLDGTDTRVQFTGPRTGPDLEAAFCSADVLVHPARVEGYGLVVTEALAHGLPVITTATGGIPDALGAAPDGVRPGLLVPPGDAPALTHAISTWLTDDDLRRRLRRAARSRRRGLPSWSTTVEQIDHVLRALA